MKKRAFLVMLMVLLCFSRAVAEQGALCRVSNGQNELWLFGSIHIGNKSMYPFSDTVLRAAREADVWFFETDDSDDDALVLSYMTYSGGDTLANHISAQTLADAERAAKKCGYRFSRLQTMKPWALVTLFGAQNLAYALGVSEVETATELGVEKQLMRLHENQRLCYLETAEQQLRMMDDFSEALQEALLRDALNGILSETGNESSVTRWPQWWREGNAAAFADDFEQEMSLVAEPLAQEYRQKVLLNRNLKMAEALTAFLEQEAGHSAFVTVGIYHLTVSEQSLPRLLEAAGYQVEVF